MVSPVFRMLLIAHYSVLSPLLGLMDALYHICLSLSSPANEIWRHEQFVNVSAHAFCEKMSAYDDTVVFVTSTNTAILPY